MTLIEVAKYITNELRRKNIVSIKTLYYESKNFENLLLHDIVYCLLFILDVEKLYRKTSGQSEESKIMAFTAMQQFQNFELTISYVFILLFELFGHTTKPLFSRTRQIV